MSDTVTIRIDGVPCMARAGQTILTAARENGIFIPSLCDFTGLTPSATCRMCTVRVKGRPATACTTPVAEGLEVENDTPELNDMRRAIVEMMFVEGNHFCPACEKSGDCELQALGYRYRMMVPRYPYQFTQKSIDARNPRLMIEENRCIFCKRCVRGIKNEHNQALFAFEQRGDRTRIVIDHELAASISPEQARQAMEICPVGAILLKERGFSTPIGNHRYDTTPIGSDVEARALQ